jgi:hypothetical protein
MTPAAEHDHVPESYARLWLLLGVCVLASTVLYWQVTKIPSRLSTISPSPTTPAESSADWFLTLRMPAITSQYESGIDTMRVRYEEWLEGMRQAGFEPMRLSEVYRRLKDGRDVPARTVVLVFEPGFRRTYEIVAPILARHEWPAVWITPTTEMSKGHREYLTYHKTAQMVQSGWWDVGYMDTLSHFLLKSKDQEPIDFGNEDAPAWSKTAGGLALNRGPIFGTMNRLHVLSDWTTADLVNRLRVEVPIDQPVYLTLAPVQNMNWGISTPQNSSEEKYFDLAVPLWRRGVMLGWFGVKSHANFSLEAEAADLIGNLAFRLRWNELEGSGLVVTVSRRIWSIQQQSPTGSVLLRRIYRRSSGGFRMSVQLTDSVMTLTPDGESPETVLLPMGARTNSGVIQIYLYDALKGSAQAKALRMLYTPSPS